MTPPQPANVRRRRGEVTRSCLLAGLAVLNLALLAPLFGRLLPDNTAGAAASAQARPSEYLMIPSRPVGLNQDVLYVLDTDNAVLTVVGFNPQARGGTMEFVDPIPLQAVFRR